MTRKNGILRKIEVTLHIDINIPLETDRKIYFYVCTLKPVFIGQMGKQYIYIINIIYKIYKYMEIQRLRGFGMQWHTDNFSNNANVTLCRGTACMASGSVGVEIRR